MTKFPHYLWHLQQIGLLETDGKPKQGVWDGKLNSVNVAIIDSGCSIQHPNLMVEAQNETETKHKPKSKTNASAIDWPLDVAVHRHGAVYSADIADGQHPKAKYRDEWAQGRTRVETVLRGLDASSRKGVGDIWAEMIKYGPHCIVAENPAQIFSGHGTACAGLVAGRTLKPPKNVNATPLKYFGVNPFATIIPIATPYSHEIRPLIIALLHAVACDADVILMPRSVNEMKAAPSVGKVQAYDPRLTRLTDGDLHPRAEYSDLAADKKHFEALLGVISKTIPVVLAAGNEGLPEPEYPASLVASPKKAHADLIVVGAANHAGKRSSYSSGNLETGVSVFAPSDDEERIDTAGRWFADIDPEMAKLVQGVIGSVATPYSPYAIFALDTPGRRDDPDLIDRSAKDAPARSLFQLFGGTSAAAATVAGIVSLWIARSKMEGKAKALPAAIKGDLQRTAKPIDSGTPIKRPSEPGERVAIAQVA
jgi:subtilisin family serine protease